MKYKVRMIAFDLDGTLLTTDKRLTGETRRTLNRRRRGGSFWCRPQGAADGNAGGGAGDSGVRYAVTANGARVVICGGWEDPAGEADLCGKSQKSLGIFTGTYDTLREIYYDGQGYMEARQMEELDHYVPDPNMAKYMRIPRSVCRI